MARSWARSASAVSPQPASTGATGEPEVSVAATAPSSRWAGRICAAARARASSCAMTTPSRAGPENRSNMVLLHSPFVLLVDRLLADTEFVGDRLPGPALGPGVGDLDGFEPVTQLAQGDDGTQSRGGVGTGRRGGGEGIFLHGCQYRLTRWKRQ